MIIRKKENWVRMLFIWEGSVLPQILPRLLLLLLLSLLVVYFREAILKFNIRLNPAPFTLFGIALAIFFGFRNNVSFDRYWEGRKLWGSLLNTTRSLTRQAHTSTMDMPAAEMQKFTDLLISFTYAAKHQLRGTDPRMDLERICGAALAEKLGPARYKPAMLLMEMGHWLRGHRARARFEPVLSLAFESNLNELSNIIGGCERIASTPVPYTYKVLLHRTVYIYCFLLPFGLVDTLGWMMPLIVTFIGYTFIALEAIADELEDPFGLEPNDLALNSLCEMIENTLLEMSGREMIHHSSKNDYIID
jgi:putative membrane protein